MDLPLDDMAKATELTRSGRLREATALIQRALAQFKQSAPGNSPAHEPLPARDNDVIDVVARVLPQPEQTRQPEQPAATEPAERDTVAPTLDATFDRRAFDANGTSYSYWLYQPGGDHDAPLPVIVMLHGCTQDGADFSAGTGMNEWARRMGCLVVYPEQRQDANAMRCWNWFEPSHQRRDAGEPAMIAALAGHVAAAHGGDSSRMYIAGLSAGGAMAATVAQRYPDVFAAVGVHSGLPADTAQNVGTAMAAMRKPPAAGGLTAGAGRSAKAAVPTIVFHGTSDRTVHPGNGKRIVQESLGAVSASGVTLQARSAVAPPSSRSVRRAVHADAAGKPWVESWEIVGAPHAWSGGRASGSYTDPQGPDASKAMLEFFLQHRRAG